MATATHSRFARHAVRRIHTLKPTAAAIAVAACFATGTAWANPTGHTVVNGQVSIQQAGNLLQVTNSPNAIIIVATNVLSEVATKSQDKTETDAAGGGQKKKDAPPVCGK